MRVGVEGAEGRQGARPLAGDGAPGLQAGAQGASAADRGGHDDRGVWAREVVETGGAVLVLHEESTAPIGRTALPEADGDEPPTAAVVVGPEGGISDAETIALENAGATAVRLGPHVMRTASAGPVALAVLAQCAGLWG